MIVALSKDHAVYHLSIVMSLRVVLYIVLVRMSFIFNMTSDNSVHTDGLTCFICIHCVSKETPAMHDYG